MFLEHFLHFCSKSTSKTLEIHRVSERDFGKRKSCKTIIKHRDFAHFRFRKFHCKNPYNSLCFGMLFWTFAQKVLQKPWKFMRFLNAILENEKVAKPL